MLQFKTTREISPSSFLYLQEGRHALLLSTLCSTVQLQNLPDRYGQAPSIISDCFVSSFRMRLSVIFLLVYYFSEMHFAANPKRVSVVAFDISLYCACITRALCAVLGDFCHSLSDRHLRHCIALIFPLISARHLHFQFLRMEDDELQGVLVQVKDANLKHTLSFGVGLHHAGLAEGDRSLVETLFEQSKIQVGHALLISLSRICKLHTDSWCRPSSCKFQERDQILIQTLGDQSKNRQIAAGRPTQCSSFKQLGAWDTFSKP